MPETAADEPGTVVVSVAAPLWATTEAAEVFPAFDGSSYPAYRGWVRQVLAKRESLKGSLDTVALCGESVRVIDKSGSLARVELPSQPNGTAGYVGFMSVGHLGKDRRRAPTHIVKERHTLGTPSDFDAPPVELPPGMTVELLAHGGQGLAQVLLPTGDVVLCGQRALHPLDRPVQVSELFRIATGYLGVPYVWGGTEAAGIDCSGLVHIAARIGGHVVPRDAHYQWEASRVDAAWEDLHVGDLIFFGSSASLDGIDHVGLYAGQGQMLHAPEEGREVTIEPISTRARERAVGFGRYPAT